MKFSVKKKVLTYPKIRRGRSWLKKVRFERYNNLSLYQFLKIFINNVDEDEISDRANGVSYNFILAIFPAIIFLFTLIPYVSNYFPAITNQAIMNFIRDWVPPSMYETIASTVFDIISNQRGGLLTFGFLLSLYLSTNGMMALMRAFNACYRTIENRHWLKMRFISLCLTLMLALVLFLAIILLVVGQFVLSYITTHISEFGDLNLKAYDIATLFILRFVVIFIVFFIAISCIYYFAPAVHKNWRFFSIGSLLSTISILGLSYGFSYYVINFGSYNKVYGSIGVLIALMVWIQLITIILLYGYEINASLHYGRQMVLTNRLQKKSKQEKASR